MKKTKLLFIIILALVALTACDEKPVMETSATDIVPETTATPAVTEASTIPEIVETIAEPATEANVPFEVHVIPVINTEQNTVHVSTVDAFIAALAPDTEIILDAELFDLSTATGYGSAKGEYYYWAETFDGVELYITGISNLTIRGGGEDHTANVISAIPRYSNVLNFENCSNIWVCGFTAGHAEEPGYCAGGVLSFQNCQDVLVEDCGLFGCGTLGVKGFYSKNMQIINNDIYDCSVGGVEFTNCIDVNVDGNTFRDLGGPVFRIYDCKNITCNGEPAIPFQ